MLIVDDVVEDLRVYLAGDESFDLARAHLVVALAMQRAQAIIDPVPWAARAVVLDVAVRGFTAPTGADTEQVGPFSRTFRTPGVFLTDAQRAELLHLAATVAGTSGAFTITPGPRVVRR